MAVIPQRNMHVDESSDKGGDKIFELEPYYITLDGSSNPCDSTAEDIARDAGMMRRFFRQQVGGFSPNTDGGKAEIMGEEPITLPLNPLTRAMAASAVAYVLSCAEAHDAFTALTTLLQQIPAATSSVSDVEVYATSDRIRVLQEVAEALYARLTEPPSTSAQPVTPFNVAILGRLTTHSLRSQNSPHALSNLTNVIPAGGRSFGGFLQTLSFQTIGSEIAREDYASNFLLSVILQLLTQIRAQREAGEAEQAASGQDLLNITADTGKAALVTMLVTAKTAYDSNTAAAAGNIVVETLSVEDVGLNAGATGNSADETYQFEEDVPDRSPRKPRKK